MSNLFKVFEVNNKDTRMASGASVVDYEHISQFILMLLLNSNKKNAGWVWETNSFRQFFFKTMRNKMSNGLEHFIGLQVFILIQPK